jgi:hypothetical protein
MASSFACLSYRDAPAAMDWLEAIGFPGRHARPGATARCCKRSSASATRSSCSRAADADYTVPTAPGPLDGQRALARP